MYRSSSTASPSSVYLDDSGPRPLPAYLRKPPPPPPEEKILTCVPDVSLILNSSDYTTTATGGRFSPVPSMNHMIRPPTKIQAAIPLKAEASSPGFQFRSREYESDGLLLELINLVKQQSVKIDRIEEQLNNFPKHQPKIYSEIGVQTDKVFITQKEAQKESGLKGLISKQHEVPMTVGTERDISPNHTEDLSKILKELQLPPISSDQSIYSVQNSSPHVDLPEFTEYNNGYSNKGEVENSPGIGPSISEYGSSDEEAPEIQPTVTYYRNVLGNVNRLLENQATPTRVPKHRVGNHVNSGGTTQEPIKLANNNLMIQQNVYNSIFIPNPNRNGTTGENENRSVTDLPPRNYLPPDDKMQQWSSSDDTNGTDTTMYGMSTSNLSFATRDYLERHGLVSNERQRLFQPARTNDRLSNRVLDSVLQNQPKFL